MEPTSPFREVTRRPFDYGDFFDFLKLRRSVRVFKDRPVEQGLIEKILEAAATAPILMLFHGNRRAMSYAENAHLACHHAMLAAVSLGLGTTIIGRVPPIVDRSKVLRKRYGIPKENKVMTSLILGHPKYKYRKSICRDLAGVRII